MSVELWKAIFDWATVVLIALTVVSGAGALITGKIINQQQETRLRQLDKGLTDAKIELLKQEERAADAERTAGEAKTKAGEAEERAGKANERAAALEIQALSLRKELVLQGPRGNLLVGEARRALVGTLRAFPLQKVDVRHSASAIMVNNKIVMTTPIGDDSLGLANGLIGALKDAGWNCPETALVTSAQGNGVQVLVLSTASAETQRAARTLVKALGEVPLVVTGPFNVDLNRAQRVGINPAIPAFDENTIVLEVLTHQ